MCGIAGLTGSYPRPTTEEAIRRMTLAQVHRGPDDEGVEVLGSSAGTVALGSRRLAIIDLTPAGHQPMVDERTGNVLAYNGEIYNFPELRAELAAKGHTFHGRGDTEVVLVGYREWGLGVLDRLRGMFALALWDKAREHMVVARDHLGIKPLYYSSSADGFACASEVRALLAGGLITPTLDRRGLAGFLAYGAVQEPLTMIEQIRSVPPGSWIEADARGAIVDEGRYWDFPTPRADVPSEDVLVAEGRALLERSVARHLLSDVPLGLFLSSGIDSTSIGGLARMASGHAVHAFTVSFPGQGDLDEGPIAARTAERLGLDFTDIAVDDSTALEWAQQGLEAIDQPSMDGLNTYIVSRAVRSAGLTVALSGQGGDEMFGGYASFRMVPRMNRWVGARRLIPGPLRAVVAGAFARSGGELKAAKARDIVSVTDLADTYFMFRRSLPDADMRSLGYVPGDLGLTSNYLDPSLQPRACVKGDPIASVSRLETWFYLGNTLLRDGDVFGMANSLELRVPMLDRDVVDWALALPGDVRLPSGRPSKHLLRLICGDFLGPDQLEQPKHGFQLPLATWLTGSLASLRAEALDAVVDAGVVDGDGLRAVERRSHDPKGRMWTRIWAFVALGRWLIANPTIR